MGKNSDNRKNKRYIVEGIRGNLLYTSDLEILNISIDGAAIETAKRLELNREYIFKIEYKNAFLDLKGRVVWAILISKERKDSKIMVPVYRAGIKFIGTLSEKANMLLDFIEENKIKTIENRLGSVRFKIASSRNIKIDVPHRYKVKKISLSGMLVETEYHLEQDSHHTIELFINNTPMNIVGRIANCTRCNVDKVADYEVGIEFIEISDNDREVLKGFLNALGDE